MKHDGVATILATGGPGMVKAAYSSGKPALGVGAGNAPAYVDKNVDVVRAANDLILSKHFDYGMICATEQAIIADKDIYAPLVKELKRRKAYFVNADEKAKLEQYMFGCTAYSGQTPKLNSVVPGKSPQYIAKAAGFEIPEDATILAAECKEVGENEPLTMEKLAPVQAVLKSDNKEQAFEMCEAMLKHAPATPPPSTPTTVTWSASTASACTPAASSGTLRAPSAAWVISTTPSPRP